jgi:hypothetical protein
MPQRLATARLATINDIKLKCIQHNLQDDPATKILFKLLDDYHQNGTIYHLELKLKRRYDRPRKFLVDLYNDINKKDTVMIRTV